MLFDQHSCIRVIAVLLVEPSFGALRDCGRQEGGGWSGFDGLFACLEHKCVQTSVGGVVEVILDGFKSCLLGTFSGALVRRKLGVRTGSLNATREQIHDENTCVK